MTCWLFVPGDNKKAQKKLQTTLTPDYCILDLEDAISEDNKAIARAGVNEFLKNYNGDIPVIIRINGTQTEHYLADLNSVDFKKVHGVILPKCESHEDVVDLLSRLNDRGYDHVKIYPLIETLEGFTKLESILKNPQLISRLVFGAVDLALDLAIRDIDLQDNPLINHIRLQIAIISKQKGLLPPIDSANIEIQNLEVLKKESIESRKIGYGGKLAIHPNQIDPIREVFKISSEETALAKEIVQIFEANNYQTIKYKNMMIDTPVYLKMKNLLQFTN